MKRILGLVLAVVIALSLVGCAAGTNSDKPATDTPKAGKQVSDCIYTLSRNRNYEKMCALKFRYSPLAVLQLSCVCIHQPSPKHKSSIHNKSMLQRALSLQHYAIPVYSSPSPYSINSPSSQP